MIVHDDALCTLYHGDCVEVMRDLPADSVDAIVTDPPYGLEFMGKEWDRLGAKSLGYGRPGSRAEMSPMDTWDRRPGYYVGGPSSQVFHEAWAREAFRVAKPGAHLLAFGGTRTYHRLASAIEDAGWEIRDCLVWAYASGFPKSLNLTGDWQGWGTALKPAWEPIVMARKPLRGTVAANVQQYGTGALNIAATRIGPDMATVRERPPSTDLGVVNDDGWEPKAVSQRSYPDGATGRWPANLLLTDPIFDGDTPGVVGGTSEQQSGLMRAEHKRHTVGGNGLTHGAMDGEASDTYGDSGTYSRFFIIPKSGRSDREPLVRGALEDARSAGIVNHSQNVKECRVCGTRSNAVHLGRKYPDCDHDDWEWTEHLSTAKKGRRENVHPTVKPLDLMRHLVRLVTPRSGLILDPFLGSGTTAIAANSEGFRCIGIEREREYLDIALARMAHQPLGLGLDVAAPTRKRSGKFDPDANAKRQKYPDRAARGWSGGWATDPKDEVPA